MLIRLRSSKYLRMNLGAIWRQGESVLRMGQVQEPYGGALKNHGMMLASLFLMWGREAFHLTQLLTEPVYFVSGLNFPVARLGMLGALAIATLPLAVGLDAMRQLAFAGSAYPTGTPPPGVEALILVAMVVVFLALSRWALTTLERRARAEGRLSVRWQ
jgi:ABC-2 type transport system permease protein